MKVRRRSGLTVFEDEADGGDDLTAHHHDGVVPGGLGERLGLAVGFQDEAPALVQKLLVVQWNAGPAAQQVLEQRRPVEVGGRVRAAEPGSRTRTGAGLTCCTRGCRRGAAWPAAD